MDATIFFRDYFQRLSAQTMMKLTLNNSRSFYAVFNNIPPMNPQQLDQPVKITFSLNDADQSKQLVVLADVTAIQLIPEHDVHGLAWAIANFTNKYNLNVVALANVINLYLANNLAWEQSPELNPLYLQALVAALYKISRIKIANPDLLYQLIKIFQQAPHAVSWGEE